MLRSRLAPPLGLSILTLFSILALGAGASRPDAPLVERYSVAGSSVAIYDLVGEVAVEPATGNEVEVEVTRGGPGGSRLRVEQGPVADVATLRVVFPAPRIIHRGPGGWGTRLEVGGDGRFGDDPRGTGSGERHPVLISGRGPGLEAHADLRVRVPAGRRFALYLAVGSATVANVDGELVVNVATAAVSTQRTRGGLKIEAGSGEVRVTDARGRLSLDTGSGRIEVRNARGEELRLDTGSGGAVVRDADVGRLMLDSGSGALDLADVRAPDVNLDSGSGPVRLDLLPGSLRSLSIDSGSGGVTIGVPTGLNAAFDIDTGSGGVRIQVPHTIDSRDGDHVRGRFGDGRGHIRIESGSGGVRVVPRSVSGSTLEGGLGGLLRFAFA